jgi:3-dehydroquinate synthase
MEIVNLDLDQHAYSIHIGAGVLADAHLLNQEVTGASVFIVTSESVAPLYLAKLQEAFSECRVDTYIIPDGESQKNLSNYESIIGELLTKRHNRATTLIALGGGVVGDVTGYVAATYQRGVNFIQIPTTLLSQVDSSVGGKTAVNHQLGKNMIGAFYQPKAVYIDTDTLQTLPERELSSGLSEVIKHGVLADGEYFSWIEQEMTDLRSLQPEKMAKAIRRSCEIKASIVAQDEKERDVRALLNLGHTFGHAIEHLMGYGAWLHGEAVGTGLVMAADLSSRLGRITGSDAKRIKDVVASAGLPTCPPQALGVNDFLESMQVDKKTTDDGLRFILINDIGEAELVTDIDEDKLRETLAAGESLAEN